MGEILSSLEDLQALCDSGVAEGLQLEFKLKDDPASADLSKNDKRAIAEVVSSFANSDGGTLVYGVRTERQGGSDIAAQLVPISDVDRFLSNVRLVCGLNISPELSSVDVRPIYTDDTRSYGFVVCDIGRSDRRPHMSTAPGVHSYFRRSFEGSALMTPSEISDQILAVREAILESAIIAGAGGSFTDLGDALVVRSDFHFSITNVGSRACMNPFLRTECNRATRSHDAIFDPRLNAWKKDIPSSSLIHVGDSLSVFSLEFSAVFHVNELRVQDNDDANVMLRAIRIHASVNPPDAEVLLTQPEVSDYVFHVTIGAENATARTWIHTFDRNELARQLLVRLETHIRDMVVGKIGVWRSDLVDKLRQNRATH